VHIAWGDPSSTGPILIDLQWYVNAGFGALAATPGGFDLALSGVLTAQQGLYDMSGTTGLTPEQVIEDAAENGEAYIIVYTDDHPDGEIRGQLILEAHTAVEPTRWGLIKALYGD
jgi:hypothetical protein